MSRLPCAIQPKVLAAKFNNFFSLHLRWFPQIKDDDHFSFITLFHIFITLKLRLAALLTCNLPVILHVILQVNLHVNFTYGFGPSSGLSC